MAAAVASRLLVIRVRRRRAIAVTVMGIGAARGADCSTFAAAVVVEAVGRVLLLLLLRSRQVHDAARHGTTQRPRGRRAPWREGVDVRGRRRPRNVERAAQRRRTGSVVALWSRIEASPLLRLLCAAPHNVVLDLERGVRGVAGKRAHVDKVAAEDWSQRVADGVAKGGGDGFGGFKWHPVS
ncbi:hypothetical protein BKA81DRAFT_360122 [Phyllosticta paracitricarpa]